MGTNPKSLRSRLTVEITYRKPLRNGIDNLLSTNRTHVILRRLIDLIRTKERDAFRCDALESSWHQANRICLQLDFSQRRFRSEIVVELRCKLTGFEVGWECDAYRL